MATNEKTPLSIQVPPTTTAAEEAAAHRRSVDTPRTVDRKRKWRKKLLYLVAAKQFLATQRQQPKGAAAARGRVAGVASRRVDRGGRSSGDRKVAGGSRCHRHARTIAGGSRRLSDRGGWLAGTVAGTVASRRSAHATPPRAGWKDGSLELIKSTWLNALFLLVLLVPFFPTQAAGPRGRGKTVRGADATWVFRGGASRRRRGRRADILWVAAPPRAPRGYSVGRGAAAGAARIFRGGTSRRLRGCRADIPWVAAPPRAPRGYSACRGTAAGAARIFCGGISRRPRVVDRRRPCGSRSARSRFCRWRRCSAT